MNNRIRYILFNGLRSDGALCTFHWNNTFLSFWDEIGKKTPISKAQQKMRYYIYKLIKEGYIQSGARRSGLGVGGFSQYGVRSFTTYMVNYTKMPIIREWLRNNSANSNIIPL